LFTRNLKFTTIITRAIKPCLWLTSTHFIKTYLITLPFTIRQLSWLTPLPGSLCVHHFHL
jgi:hypothetical protein